MDKGNINSKISCQDSDNPSIMEENIQGDGVDLSLIQWMLSLSPGERLRALQQYIHSIMRIRGEKADT
jgi:hypothetical protein